MLVLGIETTCDETAIAVVRDGREILSHVIASQEDLHRQYGGVVPELACRRHIDICNTLLRQVLDQGNLSLEEIDVIAVANGPGLIGALLIGVNFAKGLSMAAKKPLVGVNHIEAHLYASMMGEALPPLPALGVVVSGGHTALVRIEDVGRYTLVGQTHDDAIGEAFDKIAKLLGLPYPGGPHIERLARKGDPTRFSFKAGQIKGHPHDFSFSGLKTSVLYRLKGQNAKKETPLAITEQERCDVAASFQTCAFKDLVEKALLAAKQQECQSLVFGGGVSQNRALRSLFAHASSLPLFWPPEGLSLDNGAMIAGLGHHVYQRIGDQKLDVHAHPSLPLPTLLTDCLSAI